MLRRGFEQVKAATTSCASSRQPGTQHLGRLYDPLVLAITALRPTAAGITALRPTAALAALVLPAQLAPLVPPAYGREAVTARELTR